MSKDQLMADRDVVAALHERLTKTFQDFANEMSDRKQGGLRYVDALMGCHNFYKRIIFDLEERTGDNVNFYRHMAVETLALGLGIPIQIIDR
jgi:hypothetical protein